MGSAALQPTVNDTTRHINEKDFIIITALAARVPAAFCGQSSRGWLGAGTNHDKWAPGCGVSSQQGTVRAPIAAVSTSKSPLFKRYWGLIKRVSDQADADDADIVAAGLAFYGL